MVAVRRQRGAAYLSLLVAVAVVSAILANTAEIVSRTMQRDRERHLLWVGEQIRLALVSYSRIPSGVDTFPKELADLVEDRRKTVVQRHLRRMYFDPMTGSEEWGLILNPQKRIIGVYSKADRKPIRSAGFAPQYTHFAKAKSYADWRFGVGTLLPPEEAGKLPPEAGAEVPPAQAQDESSASGERTEGTGEKPKATGKGSTPAKKGGTAQGGGGVQRPPSGSAGSQGFPTFSDGVSPFRPQPVLPPTEPQSSTTAKPTPTEPVGAPDDRPVDSGATGEVDAPIEGQ
jgi:type II secretory pathway pseudopilin PulG